MLRMGVPHKQDWSAVTIIRRLAVAPLSLVLCAQSPALSLRHPTVLGMLVAAALVALLLFAAAMLWRSRRSGLRNSAEAAGEQTRLAQRLAIAEAVNEREPLTVAVWDRPGGKPQSLLVSLGAEAGVPADAAAFMAFEDWLDADSASRLRAALEELWTRGQLFSLSLSGRGGAALEARGLHTSYNAIVVLRDSAPGQSAANTGDDESLRSFLAALAHPAWLQDEGGVVIWRNQASENAGAPGAAVNLLLDAGHWAEARSALAGGRAWHRRITVARGSAKASYDLSLISGRRAVIGLAFDISEHETRRGEQEALLAAQQNAFKHLRSGIAVFGPDQRLRYANPAWCELWNLSEVFVAEHPEEEAVLDHLRAERRLPHERDFNLWKKRFLTRSRSGTVDETWYLPQGRVMRVASLPTLDGGHTVINENLTELEDLKRHHATHQRMQRETLEALTDAVAVFGSDGRLILSNPAFMSMWRLADAGPRLGGQHPHIDDLIGWLSTLHDDTVLWQRLKSSITALGEDRGIDQANLSRRDGVFIEMSTRPLPGGATLVTFVDQSAAVRIENALKERNKALEDADRLKNDFIQHVSYELRSPLNSIIGFTEMLSDPVLMRKARDEGGQDARQSEYIGYIRSQSQTLLSIIDDILTLASIDAGAIALDITRLEPLDVMTSAAAALRQRSNEAGVTLSVEVDGKVGPFNADARRVRQVLYNLVSNAIGFSARGQTVTLSAQRNAAEDVIFEVSDQGPGIAHEDQALVFDRFATKSNGTDHRGVGLGLSIVKSFVELHGGSIELLSSPGQGTRVRCVFPARAAEPHRLLQQAR